MTDEGKSVKQVGREMLTLPFLPANSRVAGRSPWQKASSLLTKNLKFLPVEAIWRGGRVVEGARLLSECTGNTVPRVQIPPSPFFFTGPH